MMRVLPGSLRLSRMRNDMVKEDVGGLEPNLMHKFRHEFYRLLR